MSEKIVITVQEGKVKGIKNSSVFSGFEFYSFFGIPYGQPPVDKLRFKDPVKVKPWKEVHDGTVERPGCIQFSLLNLEFMGTEDCLFNNIHIPKLPSKNEPLRPVIVNIHPGAYIFGSPKTKLYGSPEFIMHNDVVYVCIAYRLHILGFLNLRLKECSGNQGIKDVLLSLQWIKCNIRSFGGDPDNITLLGSSSGAAIAHVLMLSSSAKGLFHKAVLMGSYLELPTLPYHEDNAHHAAEIAKYLGYDGNLQDHKKMLIFLKKQEPLMLIEGCRHCQKNIQETIVPLYPISPFSTSLDLSSILSESPQNLTQSMSRIPVIIGFCQIESIMGFVRRVAPYTERNFKVSLRQNCFGWGHHLPDDDISAIYEEVEDFYSNGRPVEEAPLLTKMIIQNDICISDVYNAVINPISADLPSSVFVYKFDFEGDIYSMDNAFKDMMDEPINGTLHGSDFCYWNSLGNPRDKRTREMVSTFTKLITTFARTGDPNYKNFPVKWMPSTPENHCYLSINNPFEMVAGKLNEDRMEFWENIIKRYRNK